jgi:hypothetical protein
MSISMTRTLITFVILTARPVTLLHADMIYSDFGPGDSFDTDAGAVVSQTTDLRPSFAFTPLANLLLTEVDFVTSIGETGDLNEVTISLSADAGGRPGAVLASQEFDNAMGILGGEADDPPDGSGILSWLPSQEPTLLSGATYWITFDGPAPGDVTWNYNDTLQSGYSQFESGFWQSTNGTLGAIQIFGDADATAPESGTALLLGLGLGLTGMGWLKRRV